MGEKLGLAVWTEDEAGPYQTLPYPGASWQLVGHPALQPHEYCTFTIYSDNRPT